MENVHYYTTNIQWKEGRIGNLSIDGFPKIEVATPPEFPKGVPNVWSPEHLYVAAASSCLMTTFLAISENSKLDFESFDCPAEGKLEKVDGKFVISEIVLKPRVVIADEKDKERAIRIIEKSEAACLISNSMKSKISLQPEVIVK